MRVSMILEAQDKASRAVRAVQKSVAGFNRAAAGGAQKAERANQRAARSMQTLGRAYDVAARGARRAGEAGRAAARMAEQGWQRALVALGNYARRQGELIVKGGGLMAAGAGRMWEGAKGAGRVAAGLATGAGVLGIAGGMVANQIVGPAAEFERYETILSGLEGSSAAGKAALRWVSDFAAKTPYELAGVTDAFVKMRSYGLDPMNGLMTTLGDTAAAMGKPLMQAVEAVADAVTGEFERLKEFGVKGGTEGKYAIFSYTDSKGVQRSIKALKNDRKAIEKALAYIWNEKYAGSMERLSKTWEGIMGNLGDAWTRFRLAIADAGFFDYVKNEAQGLLATLNRMDEDGSLKIWAKQISGTLIGAFRVGINVAKGLAGAVVMLARGAERLATAMGGWENFSYLIIAAAFASPIYYLASGLFLVGRGAWIAGFALARVMAILSVSTTMWAFSAMTRLAAGAVMLLGRALILASVGGLRAGVLGIALLARGLVGLPAALVRAALAARALAIASLGLPGLLASAARGLALLAAAGLRALPGLLFAAARAAVAFGAALLTTPVGWIVAGIAAIAAAAYLIYTNWDSIGPWLAEKWEQIKQVFSDAWNWLTGFDWSSLIPDWSSWLPDWDWSSIIPDLSLPSFSWSSLLPDWDWSSIIPSLPDFGSWFGGGKSEPAITNAQDMAQLARQAEAAQKLIVGIGPAAQAAVQAASSALSAASFHSHGVALMETLAAGIRAGAGAAVGAVQGVTQQMRDYLPHSPAKVGPLSDLDRVRFSETLASAIRPGPAVAAVRAVASGMRGAVAGVAMSAPIAAMASPASAGLPVGGGGGGGGVSVEVSYSPSIQLPAGTPQEQAKSFAEQLRAHADELARLVEEAARRGRRTEY